MSRMRKALLVVLTLALIKRPVGKLLAAVLPDISVAVQPQLLASAAASLLLLGVPALLLRPWRSPRLMRPEKQWPCWLLGMAAAVLIRAAMTPVDAAWQGALGLGADALPMPGNAAEAALYILCLAVIPAAAEEAFFRGSLLTGLLDGSRRWTAALLTAVSFVLMHGSLASLPSLLAVSLLLTLLMLHSGTVAIPVMIHFFYNICALVWKEPPMWGSLLSGVLLIALAVYMIVRQPRIAHLPMGWTDRLIAAAALIALTAQYLL